MTLISCLSGERQLLFTHMQKRTYTFTGFKTSRVEAATFLNTQSNLELIWIVCFWKKYVILTLHLFIYFILKIDFWAKILCFHILNVMYCFDGRAEISASIAPAFMSPYDDLLFKKKSYYINVETILLLHFSVKTLIRISEWKVQIKIKKQCKYFVIL